MAQTQLSPTGTPGRPYGFLPKAEAAGEHTGSFTTLSIIGVPGRIHSFLAKTPTATVEHEGLFTELAALGVPGKRHSFLAKTAYEIPIVPVVEVSAPPRPPMGGITDYMGVGRYERLIKEDEELLEIIKIIVAAGII